MDDSVKKFLAIILIPLATFAAQDKELVVVNSPIHPWNADGGKALIVNFSKINFDTRLIKAVRKHQEVSYPFINLSGKIDTITSAIKKPKTKRIEYSTKILTAKMHITSIVRKNIIGHFAFKFSPNNPVGGKVITNKTAVKLDRAFITFDIQDYVPIFPTYITVGQLFMPFGTYTTNQLTESMVSEMGKESGEILKAGFMLDKSLTGAFFVSNLNTRMGVDLKYNLAINKTKLNIGISLINKSKQEFAITNSKGEPSTEKKNIGPSLIPFVSIEVNKIGIRTELLTALTKDKIDRKLLAARFEGFYSFLIKGKFCSTGIGYENLINKSIAKQPRYRINATFNAVFLPFTFSSFEVKLENHENSKKSIGAAIRFGVAY